jgi:hypothetical protein
MQEHALRMKVQPTCLGLPELSMARRIASLWAMVWSFFVAKIESSAENQVSKVLSRSDIVLLERIG